MHNRTVWILKLFVIWGCIAQTSQQYGDNVPNSPCPRLFQYKYNGDWYGELQLPSPPIQPGEIVLTVVLTLRAATSVSFSFFLSFIHEKSKKFISASQFTPEQFNLFNLHRKK